jgi:hypothetical protein
LETRLNRITANPDAGEGLLGADAELREAWLALGAELREMDRAEPPASIDRLLAGIRDRIAAEDAPTVRFEDHPDQHGPWRRTLAVVLTVALAAAACLVAATMNSLPGIHRPDRATQGSPALAKGSEPSPSTSDREGLPPAFAWGDESQIAAAEELSAATLDLSSDLLADLQVDAWMSLTMAAWDQAERMELALDSDF